MRPAWPDGRSRRQKRENFSGCRKRSSDGRWFACVPGATRLPAPSRSTSLDERPARRSDVSSSPSQRFSSGDVPRGRSFCRTRGWSFRSAWMSGRKRWKTERHPDRRETTASRPISDSPGYCNLPTNQPARCRFCAIALKLLLTRNFLPSL